MFLFLFLCLFFNSALNLKPPFTGPPPRQRENRVAAKCLVWYNVASGNDLKHSDVALASIVFGFESVLQVELGAQELMLLYNHGDRLTLSDISSTDDDDDDDNNNQLKVKRDSSELDGFVGRRGELPRHGFGILNL